jgi:hypothetical protein
MRPLLGLDWGVHQEFRAHLETLTTSSDFSNLDATGQEAAFIAIGERCLVSDEVQSLIEDSEERI